MIQSFETVANLLNEAERSLKIKKGPKMVKCPEMVELTNDILLRVISEFHEPVTTSEELIPSVENKNASEYLLRAKEVYQQETVRRTNTCPMREFKPLGDAFRKVKEYYPNLKARATGIGTVIYAVNPGDGLNDELAVACQKVTGGWANIAKKYASEGYRSNLIDWGMIPFLFEADQLPFKNLDFLFIPGIRQAIEQKASSVTAYVVRDTLEPFELKIVEMTDKERQIILDGCLMNYNRFHE